MKIIHDRILGWTLRHCCVLAAFLYLILALSSPVELKAKTVLKVGVYNNRPTIFVSDNGKVKGLFIDILESVAKEEGWKLVYEVDHFSILLEKLRNGDIDLMPAIAYSRERERFVDYTFETVMANWAELYVPSNQKLTTLLELEGKKIAVKQGDIHFFALKKMVDNFNLNCRFLETDEYSTVFEMLESRYVDVGVVNRLYGNREKSAYKVKPTPVIFNPVEMRFGVPKGKNEDVIGALDSHLVAYKNDENSIYYAAINKWFVVDGQSWIPTWLLYVLGAAAVCIAFFVCTAGLLRYQVRTRTKQLVETNVQLEGEVEERKRAESGLRMYARMVEASSDAMALLDRDHRLIHANTAYWKLFSGGAEQTDALVLPEVFGKEFFDMNLSKPVTRCLDGQTVHLQSTRRTPIGTLLCWDFTLSPYNGNDGSIDGYVIDIRDVTKETELQSRLKNAQKMEAIGLLAGGVAHDLNNILSGLVSYPDMLLLNRSPEDAMTEPLKIIRKSGERAASIVQDLLTLSRKSAGNIVPLNLNNIVRDFLDSPERRNLDMNFDGIEYLVGLDDELFNICGSAAHLTKIFMNLYTNALEAMPDGGILSISTQNRFLETEKIGYELVPAGEYSVLRLKDTGDGISEMEMGRLFEPFYTTKVMGKSGTGLGMAVVWGAMKDHNGYIDVISHQSNGAEFVLYFPVTRESIPKEDKIGFEEYIGNGEEILVIDDMPEQRRIATEILGLLGYQVEMASSGEEAVTLCEQKDYDLLLLDMIMPGGIDGLETYSRIKTVNPGQKALIASGFSESINVREAQSIGAGSYLRKPYTVKSLARAVSLELSPQKTTSEIKYK